MTRRSVALLAALLLGGWAQPAALAATDDVPAAPAATDVDGPVEVSALVERPGGRVEVRRQRAATPAQGRTLAGRWRAERGVLAADVAVPVQAFSTVPAADPLQSRQWGLTAARASDAWRLGGADGQVVAVIDSGVDLSHPDLAAALLSGRDLVDGDRVPQDLNGHGTHVTGIVGGIAGNGVGGAGAALRARVLPVRVLDAAGSGSSAAVAEGVVWAVDNGATVVNLSLGGPRRDSVLERAVAYALSRGVPVVAAAGNEALAGDPVNYPAALPGVIAVGAVDRNGVRAPFSSTGAHLSVAAPGVDVLSTTPGGGYGSMSGTSMAAPFVASAAALVRRAEPGLSPAAVRDRLQRTARDLGIAGQDPEHGAGLVDVVSARTADARPFVRALHLDLLSREPSAAEVDRWTTALASGASTPHDVAYALARTDEWLRVVVTGFYRSTLRRDPDADGLAFWVRHLQSGMPVADVASRFYASPEYYARVGGTDESWVRDLYRELLLREGEASGVATWTEHLRRHGAVFVAVQFYGSPETLQRRVDALYLRLLQRSADSSGLRTWPSVVAAQGDLVLAAYLASSPEYWARAQSR